jgi:hypothetical protein
VQRILLILGVIGGLAACVNVVDPEEDGYDAAQQGAPSGQAASPLPPNDDPVPPSNDDEPAPPANNDDEPSEPAPPAEDEEIPGDEDDDGVVNVDEPGPPPSDAGQSCSEWTDCGPHFEDPNSGFDCVNNSCTCDDTGQWAAACADIGGSWSSFECFCFTNTDTAMPAAAPETPEQAEEDVVCWWSWRLRYCDPDEWVDTSYYEYVCDSEDDCYNEYVEDGYYIDGQCYGRWIKRCTDGNEYWY